MSGICGVYRFAGASATLDDLAGMLEHLSRRGPDASAGWHEGPAALGHTLLATTPEAQAERMPVHHCDSGCTITGDIRIDNRGELLAALRLDPACRIIGDGELVLSAYLKWGSKCLERLLGDFAFAIWDAPRRRLLCARDQVGMRQLIYHHSPGKLFAFATEVDALLAHPAVPKQINEARIADFLEDLEAYDLTSTFYREIYRLPPAHALTVEGEVLRVWRYWEPAPPATLSLSDDAAYAEAFLAVFTDAVSARIRAPVGKLGAMLSGGMDSGSVTAVAARLLLQEGSPPLPVFSATGEAKDCVETRTIRAAQTMPHLAPHDIAVADFAEYADALLHLSQQSGEPFDSHMSMLRAVYLAARKSGTTVMLDGACGDTTLMADDMVAWRLRRRDVVGAWREAEGARRFWGEEMPALRTFLAGARQVVVPECIRALRRYAGAPARQRRMDRTSLVAPALAQAINMPGRREVHHQHVALKLDGRCDDRRALVTHPYAVVARERYDRVAAALAIETRDPFLDRRLLTFCLSLPADQIERGGWPKFILRQAMAGLLPDAVRWRLGKEHIGWLFEEALATHWLSRWNGEWQTGLEPFVAIERLSRADNLPRGDFSVATMASLSYLQWWLSR